VVDFKSSFNQNLQLVSDMSMSIDLVTLIIL